jgi:hypothetical protein
MCREKFISCAHLSEHYNQFLFWGYASCCAYFIKVFDRTVLPNNFQGVCLYLFRRYMFRPSLATSRRNTQLFSGRYLTTKDPFAETCSGEININKHLKKLLRGVVLPITMTIINIWSCWRLLPVWYTISKVNKFISWYAPYVCVTVSDNLTSLTWAERSLVSFVTMSTVLCSSAYGSRGYLNIHFKMLCMGNRRRNLGMLHPGGRRHFTISSHIYR